MAKINHCFIKLHSNFSEILAKKYENVKNPQFSVYIKCLLSDSRPFAGVAELNHTFTTLL